MIGIYQKAIVLASVIFGIADADVNTWRDVSYRVDKLNFIWSKAIHHISDKAALEYLKTELEKYDKLYLSAKSESSKNGQHLLHEIDTKLEKLLSKYGIESTVNAYNKKRKWRNDEQIRQSNSVLPSETFSDANLKKIWVAALDSGFSDSQLKALHKEMKDHERNMESYEEKLLRFNHVNENVLNDDSMLITEQFNQDLKSHHRAVQNSYDELYRKVFHKQPSQFVNEKVEKLWYLANENSNLTRAELESIHLELTHFDRQLEKLRLHNDELAQAKTNHNSAGKLNVLNDDIQSFEVENSRLARKLRKLENEISSRLAHTEL